MPGQLGRANGRLQARAGRNGWRKSPRLLTVADAPHAAEAHSALAMLVSCQLGLRLLHACEVVMVVQPQRLQCRASAGMTGRQQGRVSGGGGSSGSAAARCREHMPHTALIATSPWRCALPWKRGEGSKGFRLALQGAPRALRPAG